MGLVKWKRSLVWLLASLAISAILWVLLLSTISERVVDKKWMETSDGLGLTIRESQLADRVRDVESQNRLLRHQLSASQSRWLMAQQSLTTSKSSAHEVEKVGRNRPQDNSVEDNDADEDDTDSDTASKACKEEDSMPKCEVLQIAMVCAGHNSSRSVVTVVKSLLFYRKHPVHLHFLTDPPTETILKTVFETWLLNQVKVSFYDLNTVVDQVEWIPNKHYSGVYGLLKLTLPNILPKWLTKIIVLDTDVILATDISKLWRLFEKRASVGEACVGLVENQSDWYLPGHLWKGHSPWPALGRGFNTGVILMDLQLLRTKWQWPRLWRQVAEKELITMFKTTLADQDIFNSVIKAKPDIVFKLPCQWNLQLSDNTRSEICYSNTRRDLNIIHFNSPKKLDVKNKDVEYFRNLYTTFAQFDGNLLRHDLINCQNGSSMSSSSELRESSNGQRNVGHSETHLQEMAGEGGGPPPPVPPESLDQSGGGGGSDACYDLKQAASTVYRTHPYFLPYDFRQTTDVDVTLTAQLSMDRLHMVEELCKHWPGPMSLALYVSDSEADQFVHFALASEVIRQRTLGGNIGFHIVYKGQNDFYPVNYLRNVALKHVRTNYVFLSDIDFLPGAETYESLIKSVRSFYGNSQEELTAAASEGDSEKLALVVAAFETQRYRLQPSFPKTKSDAIKLLDVGTLLTFRYHVWPQGHRATNYAKWKTATTPYRIAWEPEPGQYNLVSDQTCLEQDFEPYIVLPTRWAHKFDQRFVGFGWNKVSYTMELVARGFQYWVLPSVFLVHMPHAPSLDIAKFRSSKSYRRCLKLLKKAFVNDMKLKYGKTFAVQPPQHKS